MRTHTTVSLGLLVVGILALGGATPAWAGDVSAGGPGAMNAAQGETLLQQGKLLDAAKAYAGAARAEPKNAAYRDRAVTLKRMAGLQRFAAKGQPSERWNRAVYSLHLFYLQNGVPHLAVDIDRKAYDLLKTPESAGWLAQAYLAAGQNAEATNLLAPYSGNSPRHAVYHTIALARLGSLEAAQKVSQNTRLVNVELDAAGSYDYARMWTLLGNPDSAILLLKSAFEKTPAQALLTFKARVRAERDFATLAALPAFAEVMKTESKVAQTCSGGSSCAGCPNRGKCGGGK